MAKKDVQEVAEATPAPAKEAVTEAFMQKVFESTRDQLHAQPQFKIRLKPESKAKPGDITVQINGYTYHIMRGQEVEVPQTVRDILEEAGEL